MFPTNKKKTLKPSLVGRDLYRDRATRRTLAPLPTPPPPRLLLNLYSFAFDLIQMSQQIKARNQKRAHKTTPAQRHHHKQTKQNKICTNTLTKSANAKFSETKIE